MDGADKEETKGGQRREEIRQGPKKEELKKMIMIGG